MRSFSAAAALASSCCDRSGSSTARAMEIAPTDAGHRLCGQRGVGLGSAGRTGAGHGFHLPPLHPAGRNAPLAGWSLLAGGVASSAAAALVVAGGGLASGKILVAAVAVPGGVLAVTGLAVVAAAVRRAAAARRAGAARRRGRCGTGPGCSAARPVIPARPSAPGLSGSARSSFPRRAG